MKTASIEDIRHSMKHNLLRNVLIRLDYTGITNIDNWVEKFQPVMKNWFSIYSRGVQNNMKANLTSIEDIAENLSIPIEEIRKETIHEFTGWLKDDNNVTMSISPYFMTINIRCNNYTSIDTFLDLTSLFLKNMYKNSPYFNIHRIGIRKVNGKAFNTMEEVLSIYRKELFFGAEVDEEESLPIGREYTYRYVLKDFSLKVNYSRQYRLYNSIQGLQKHQVLLDIDTYIDKSCIDKNKYNLMENSDKILKMMNEHQFKIFMESVQESYLCNAKQK